MAIATAMLMQQPLLSSPDSSHFFTDTLNPLPLELSTLADASACFKLAAQCIRELPAADSSMTANSTAPAQQSSSKLSALLIFYPCLDPARSGTSHVVHAESPTLAASELAWFWKQYVPGCRAEARGSCLYRLLHACDDTLRLMPPCFIATAGQDPLCDDGFALATRLQVPQPDSFHTTHLRIGIV